MVAVDSSPGMEISHNSKFLAFLTERRAAEAVESFDGAVTSDREGVTVACYNVKKNEDEEEKDLHVDTSEMPTANIPPINDAGAQPREFFGKRP